MDNRDNRRLDVFGASVISRRHRVLCDLGLTFHYFRRSSGNRGSFVSNTTSGGNTFQVFLRVSNGVTWESNGVTWEVSKPEVEAGIFGVTNLEKNRRLGNLPLIHVEFEELELDRRELDKQDVEQPEVDRFDLDESGVAEHMLNIHEGCLPVRQKTRGQAPERNKLAIKPDDGKKHDSSWRMCVDFKDLNKACPKDGYLLLEIDWKVESLYKVEAVLSLPSPKCLKDVQRLNGKLEGLNRFLSKSVEKSLPFFKTLKK
ncbi:hypothetical protein Tco_0689419 [Tanacetum coccineum]